jgi:hypothetical protein
MIYIAFFCSSPIFREPEGGDVDRDAGSRVAEIPPRMAVYHH